MTGSAVRAMVILALVAVIAFLAPRESMAAESKQSTAPAADAAQAGGLAQVTRGTTTQSDLLNLFGGPNLTTVDSQGRDVWVYERTVAQTDSRSATNAAAGSVDFSVFWGAGDAGVSASTDQSATTLTSGSSIRTVTALVTFAPDHTVLDYTVTAKYF